MPTAQAYSEGAIQQQSTILQNRRTAVDHGDRRECVYNHGDTVRERESERETTVSHQLWHFNIRNGDYVKSVSSSFKVRLIHFHTPPTYTLN